ncbi:MAG: hypothetical protein IPI27_07145 [Betaproteobacteria bacterium]|nr:hypothetical protein [Betaproteobacteria bacterium]
MRAVSPVERIIAPMRRFLAPSLLLFAALAAAPLAGAQKGEFVPKPDTYLCPNSAGPGAVDCFLNAVEHLYTMCRQVKSIEIIEFGYEKSEEGVNGAKSEYCVDKHRVSMTRPYQAALREATGSRGAIDHLRALHDQWLQSLQSLKWKPGETDADYKARIGLPYEAFKERALAVQEALKSSLAVKSAAAATPPARARDTAKAAPKAAPRASASASATSAAN